MKRSLVILVACVVVAGCAESSTPSQIPDQDAAGVAFARGGVGPGGAQFLHVDPTGVDALLPGGFCSFRPDDSGEFNNFLRTNPNEKRFLKIEDASGSVSVVVFGGSTWSGKGRVNVSWPDYPTGQSFEMTMVGDHDAAGHAATCNYKIANGVAVQAEVKTK